jgi:hypothetical protein
MSREAKYLNLFSKFNRRHAAAGRSAIAKCQLALPKQHTSQSLAGSSPLAAVPRLAPASTTHKIRMIGAMRSRGQHVDARS